VNHLNYATSPDLVASPAQLDFMVALAPGQPYYPCSERVFEEIIGRVNRPFLRDMYNDAWSRISELVRTKIEDPALRAYLTELLNIKFEEETANYNVIPSRLEKRLYKLIIVSTQIEDPMAEEKEALNRWGKEVYDSEGFYRAANRSPGPHVPAHCFHGKSLESTRRHLDATKLRRLLQASVQTQTMNSNRVLPTEAEWDAVFKKPISGHGWEQLENFLLTPREDLLGYWVPRKILYLANGAGEIIFDLAVVKFLIRLGHTVVLSVKNAAFYDMVYMGDVINSQTLKELTDKAEIITDRRLTKNQIATLLRNNKPFKIITDGTMEHLNLMRTSVTFARAFKEVDGVISKGPDQRRRFFETPFEFTRNIFSLALGPDQTLNVLYRPRCTRTAGFSTSDLEAKAEEIMAQMRQAIGEGMPVMFYSGIVGSIPGETDTAIEIMTTFVEDLQQKQTGTLIINPSKYFESGMDADDLMYIWEIVQRSGLIDIWRFQTYQDVERGFALLGRKVPPQWVGKDATFSTGCTKERAIAADVQKTNPEMQIIGPDQEKFIRRSDYGIGLFHDTRLNQIYEL
jgi:uncharacterized protein with ATP-grasp and redox domains